LDHRFQRLGDRSGGSPAEEHSAGPESFVVVMLKAMVGPDLVTLWPANYLQGLRPPSYGWAARRPDMVNVTRSAAAAERRVTKFADQLCQIAGGTVQFDGPPPTPLRLRTVVARCLDLTQELPDLLDVLWTAGHEITPATYNIASRQPVPRRMPIQHRTVRLGGLATSDPASVRLSDSWGRERIDCAVCDHDLHDHDADTD
jgi:hypothetical protein